MSPYPNVFAVRAVLRSAEYLEVDDQSCRLLGPTGLVVQALMGLLAILSLVYKRHREKPIRPWKIWLFDVSKQVVGQMFVHGLNVLISNVGSHRKNGSNACVFYFLNILLDTTIGIGIIYIILHILTYLLTEKMGFKGFESGVYGTPPSFSFWIRQAAVYVLSLTSMKLLVIASFACLPVLITMGERLLGWTRIGSSDSFQIIFTMGIFPIIMNILQFWLVDSIVKASGDSNAKPTEQDPDREPLCASPSDDDNEGAGHDIENPPSSRVSNDKVNVIDSAPTQPPTLASGMVIPSNTSNSLQDSMSAHAYPPSSLSSGSSIFSKPKRKYRRSPPPPIAVRSFSQPVINSPQRHVESRRPSRFTKLQRDDFADDSCQDLVSSWEDSDDWAERVGEEEWAGKRITEKTRLEDWDSPVVKLGS